MKKASDMGTDEQHWSETVYREEVQKTEGGNVIRVFGRGIPLEGRVSRPGDVELLNMAFKQGFDIALHESAIPMGRWWYEVIGQEEGFGVYSTKEEQPHMWAPDLRTAELITNILNEVSCFQDSTEHPQELKDRISATDAEASEQ